MKKYIYRFLVLITIILIGIIIFEIFLAIDRPRKEAERMASYQSSYDYFARYGMYESDAKAFNERWEMHSGPQQGNNIKALLQKLIANCHSYADWDSRLIDIAITRACENDEEVVLLINEDTLSNEKNTLSSDSTIDNTIAEIRNKIEPRHTYYVELEYSQKTSLVNRILIRYEEDDVFNTILPDID
jgi:hypothetical protein